MDRVDIDGSRILDGVGMYSCISKLVPQGHERPSEGVQPETLSRNLRSPSHLDPEHHSEDPSGNSHPPVHGHAMSNNVS